MHTNQIYIEKTLLFYIVEPLLKNVALFSRSIKKKENRDSLGRE